MKKTITFKIKNLFYMLLVCLVFIFGLHQKIYAVYTDEAPAKVIDILAINDFHGNVLGDSKNPGASKIIGYIKDRKANNPNTIVVSAGDNYKGTKISNSTFGKPVSEMFKAINLLASVVGNHEFDWGVDKIPTWAEEGGFDFLAANILDIKTGSLVEWAKPYKIVEIDGIKIAFIGLAHPDTPSFTKEKNTKGLVFIHPTPIAKEWVNFLKEGKAKEGVPDVIIALTHLDSELNFITNEIKGKAVELANIEGIDGIITGHSHKVVVGKVNDVPIVQAYYNGLAIGILSIKLDENNNVIDIEPSVDLIYKRIDELPSASALEALF
jgi:2',3'-cyclic-nucleotide 2'-phosphodiesterase (5'-nucleotidase family)